MTVHRLRPAGAIPPGASSTGSDGQFRSRSTPPPVGYAELQAVSNFSFLEGASHPHELVETAQALGLSALAVADRNTLAGVVRTHVAAKAAGLRTIVGARLDLVDAPRLVVLPRDRAAYGRLSRLLTLGQRRADKGGCILALADVAAYADGQVVIALPPPEWSWRETLGGEAVSPGLARAVAVPGDREPLETSLRRIVSVLAPARVHLAATYRHGGDDRARITALARIGARVGAPIVATGDVRYHVRERRRLADVLASIRAGATVATAGLMLGPNAERHLRPPAEMARLFAGHEAALARTCEIADLCRFSLDELAYEYPDEPVPPGKSPQAHLEDLARAGARRRFPKGVPANVAAKLEHELALIAGLGYAPYFLTVNDIVAFAHARGILAQGRGSAANSVVCFCLGITSVDPTEIDVLFERFVSAERREPPDIDVDFEHERREEVIQYVYERYGRERAGLAATVISYRARSAVREVGRAMGLSADTVAALAGMVWGTRSGGALPEAHVREAGLDPADPLLAEVLDIADELIGFPRHLSQHVGGFVLTRGPLVEVVPVGNAAMAERTFIEWDKDDLAALGLMKVDVLALGMLTCIAKAFDLVARHHGRQLDLAAVPRDDPAVYDMLCRADSLGVFQVESRAQMNMLPRLRPRVFYDLVIEVAIVRPGPIQGDMVHPYLRRRMGAEAESYPSPAPEHGEPDELARILSRTKGVPLFQEQAMRIASVAARFTDAEVNELRKAMATFRRRGTIGRLEEKMITRMVARGYERTFAERCFNQIKGFGEYGFPESHAASFALLVYVSSWLKCHHPAAFAAALLNSQPMGFYAPAQIVRDAREHGVEVREADVNHSEWDCTLEPACRGSHRSGVSAHVPRTAGEAGPALRLGLRQVDGLVEDEIRRMVGVRDRPSGGRFRDPQDLALRAGLGAALLERLAAADCFRSMGLDRRRALWAVKGLEPPMPLFEVASSSAVLCSTRAQLSARAQPADVAAGAGAELSDGCGTIGPQSSAGADSAGFAEPEVMLPPMATSAHVVADYQTLRLSLKAHPMSFLRDRLEHGRVLACAGLASLGDGVRATVAGVVLVRQRPGSAKGVVFMTIEDETGIANVVVWPRTLERFRRVVMAGRLVLIRGRVQRHEDIVHLVSTQLEDLSGLLDTLAEAPDASVPVPIARADEVRRPEPGSARSANPERLSARGQPSPRHPRQARIIPRSRDFH